MNNNILNLSLISFSLIILCFISTNVVYNTIYAQIFEFNEKDYYSSSDNEPTDSQEKSTNSEDTGKEDYSSSDNEPTDSQEKSTNFEDTAKEDCITNQEASVLQTSTDSDTYLNNFHFIKKFDREGNLVDSWGTVGSDDGQFLHAHGITIDLKDNVYVSDGALPRVQKFDSEGNFIKLWGKEGSKKGQFVHQHDITVDPNDMVYVAEYSGKNIQKFDSQGNFLTMW